MHEASNIDESSSQRQLSCVKLCDIMEPLRAAHLEKLFRSVPKDQSIHVHSKMIPPFPFLEASLEEMNTHALQVTNHNCGKPPESWNCDGNGDPLIKPRGSNPCAGLAVQKLSKTIDDKLWLNHNKP